MDKEACTTQITSHRHSPFLGTAQDDYDNRGMCTASLGTPKAYSKQTGFMVETKATCLRMRKGLSLRSEEEDKDICSWDIEGPHTCPPGYRSQLPRRTVGEGKQGSHCS